MTRKDQLPIQAALSLLAREQMSGEQSPASARRILDMWRATLGETADSALVEMNRAQDDQKAYARAARKLLAALDLAEAESDADPEDQTEDGEEGGEQSGEQDEQQDGSGQSEAEQDSMLGANPEEMEGDAADDEGTESDDDAAVAEGDDRPGGPQPRRERPNPDNEAVYRAYTRLYDEEIDAEELCDPDELTRLRQQLDQQLQHLQGVTLEAGQSTATAAAGAANARLGIRSGRRPAGRGTAVTSSGEPNAGAVLQARTRHGVPRHRRHAVDRQLGFNARAADHRGGDVR